MEPTRRQLLAGMASLLALPTVATAAPLPAALEAERRALLEATREAALSLDLGALIGRALREIGLPGPHVDEVRRILSPLDLTRGLRSVGDLLDLEGEPAEDLQALAGRLQGERGVRKRLKRFLKRAPATPEARRAWIDHLVTDWLGVDLPALRAHVARYPTQELVIAFGPVSQISGLLGLVLYEPFALYLQVAHGTRARVLFSHDERALARVVEAFVDPGVRRVALVGHGTWDTWSVDGLHLHPDDALERLTRLARSDPRELARRLATGRVWKLLPGPWRRGVLREEELADLAEQVQAPPKDLIVRHTCGAARYDRAGALLWLLLPVLSAEGVHVQRDGVGPLGPDRADTWDDRLREWLADRSVDLTERAALGTACVTDPQDTRGYAGLAWVDHFVAEPIPAWRPPAQLVAPGGPAVVSGG